MSEASDLDQALWRPGRTVGRTIYAVVSDNPLDHPLIGMMDTAELAAQACRDHNEVVRGASGGVET